ncbi:MAG: hypothetical protein OEY66_07055 [Gammaproteobacteria bacterium]|nr:hypothetical protein [Gammaproteobacteria bacterium]
MGYVTPVTAYGLRVSQLQARRGAGCDGVTAVTPVSRARRRAHLRARTHADANICVTGVTTVLYKQNQEVRV